MTEPLEPTAVSLTYLKTRCAYWQGVLRLQDWDIDVSIVRRHAMPRPTTLAAAKIEIYRRAKILLLDPTDWHPEDWPADRDLEISLVHELLHLVFYDVGTPEPDSQKDIALERAVEATAIALVTLDRHKAATT